MRRVFAAICWAAAILMLAGVARTGGIDRNTADWLLMILPMIAFVTLLDGKGCRRLSREA